MNAMPYSLEICNVRVNKVLDKGAEYDGPCKGGYRPECVKLSASQNKKIADGLVKTRNCDRIKTCWCRYNYGNFVLERPYQK